MAASGKLSGTGSAGGMTRRDFLRSAGAAIAGSVVLEPDSQAGAAPDAPQAANIVRSRPLPIMLDVNGRQHVLEVEPQATLAEVLRGLLGLTGTKIGCDRGACSACTVWVDRAPILSCMLLAVDVGERKIVTIEGLARGEQLHPVQAAFIARDAIQCGFCTPGLIMSCAALVENNRDPSAEDAKAAISGHLCRCGTYPHVLEAVRDAAQAMKG